VILLVNGPNLNLLGERETGVFGTETLADVERRVSEACRAYGVEVRAFQSNGEGALIDFIQEHRHAAQGLILNPGALAHTSRALADCVAALSCPTVVVHLSNIDARARERGKSLLAPVALGQITGLGLLGYYYAALHLCTLLSRAAEEGERAGAASWQEALARARPSPVRMPTPAGSGVAIPPEPDEEVPEDLTARGEYEPL